MSNDIIIAPSVGRKVWYRRNDNPADDGLAQHGHDPLDATIVAVWGDRMINVALHDANGHGAQRTSVALLQAGDRVPAPGNPYCEWIPFQAGQAKKPGDATDEIMKFFTFAHLPLSLQAVSVPFAEHATRIVDTISESHERLTALRKLLEAKDAAVRAYLLGVTVAKVTT